MFKRKRLTLDDIEDADDKHHRRLKQRTPRKEIQLLFGNEDEDEDIVPVFSQRLKQVERKLQRGITESSSVAGAAILKAVLNRSSQDDNKAVHDRDADCGLDTDTGPVLVLDELDREDSVWHIDNVSLLCNKLIDTYEERHLHRLFDTPERNCCFRLFLYTIAFGTFTHLEPMFVDVLKQLSAEDQAKASLEEQLGTSEKSLDDLDLLARHRIREFRKTYRVPDSHIVRSTAPLNVPKHIQKRFEKPIHSA